MEENRKKVVNHEELTERLDRIESKLNVVLEGEASIMNALGSFAYMRVYEHKLEEDDESWFMDMCNDLVESRDRCMREVYGEAYKKIMDVLMDGLEDLKNMIAGIFR